MQISTEASNFLWYAAQRVLNTGIHHHASLNYAQQSHHEDAVWFCKVFDNFESSVGQTFRLIAEAYDDPRAWHIMGLVGESLHELDVGEDHAAMWLAEDGSSCLRRAAEQEYVPSMVRLHKLKKTNVPGKMVHDGETPGTYYYENVIEGER